MAVIEPNVLTDCTTDIADVSFDFCNPKFEYGDIRVLYISKYSDPGFTDIENLSEWTTKLNPSTGTIKKLWVSAEKPKGTPTSQVAAGGFTKTTTREHAINGIFDQLNDTNYEFLLALQNGGKFRIWYQLSDGGTGVGDSVYGGNSGIEVSVDADSVHPRDAGAFTVADFSFTWKSLFAPSRSVFPAAA